MAFFDLDETITRIPTIARFIPFYIHRRPQKIFHLIFIGLFGLLRLLRIINTETMKRSLSSLFAGESVSSLDEIGKEFAGIVVKTLCYKDSLAEIEKHKREGRILILISASYEFYVKAVGEALGFNYSFGSLLWRHQDKITGKLYGKNCLNREKIYRLRSLDFFQYIDKENSYSYSDSHSDIPLLSLAANAFCVNPTRALRRESKKRGFTVVRWR